MELSESLALLSLVAPVLEVPQHLVDACQMTTEHMDKHLRKEILCQAQDGLSWILSHLKTEMVKLIVNLMLCKSSQET